MFYILRQRDGIPIASKLRGVLSGLEAGAGGAADRLTGKRIGKQRAFFSQLVKARGDRKFLAVASGGVKTLLIGKIKYNIGII